MKTIYTLFVGLVSVWALSSCYEDKGNYDYLPYHRVKVEVNNLYGMKKPETTADYTISPKVTLSDGSEDLSGVSFLWMMNTSSNQFVGDTLSTEKDVTIHVDPEDKKFTYNYYLRLYVTEHESGVTNMYPVNLRVIKPYEQSWVVLHDVDGHAELGSVEFAAGEVIVTPDALSKERAVAEAEPLTGKAVALGRRQVETYYAPYWGGLDTNTQLYVSTTNPAESGLVNQTDHFLMLANWERMIFPGDIEGFGSDDICFANCYQAGVLCSHGKVYQGSGYSFLMYGMEPDAEVASVGDSYIEKVYGLPTTTLAFDSKNHRFLIAEVQNNGWGGSGSHNPSEMRGDLQVVPNTPQNVKDPGEIDPEQKLVDLVGGYWYAKTTIAAWQRHAVNAFMLNERLGKSYVYTFHGYPLTNASGDPEDCAPLSAYYSINTPEGVTTETPMTSGWDFNNILFYAVDNKIFKLDFAMAGGSSTLIYQHPDPNAKVSCLQMAYEEFTYRDVDGVDNYGHPYNRVMAAGFNLPGDKGEVVILQLNTSGRVDNDSLYPAIQQYGGFGKIKDLTFIL